jgi:hypothetical protein
LNFNQLFPSKYVSAADLTYGPKVLRIAGISQKQMGDGEIKPVVAFHDGKPMVLNRTNGEMLRNLYGSDLSGWIDQPIELYATTTQFGFKTVECVRLRPPSGPSKAGLSGQIGSRRTTTPVNPLDADPALADDPVPF